MNSETKELVIGLGFVVLAFVYGFFTGMDARHDDYNRGWHDGFAIARQPSPQDRIVGNMLCSYAKLACTLPAVKHE